MLPCLFVVRALLDYIDIHQLMDCGLQCTLIDVIHVARLLFCLLALATSRPPFYGGVSV